MSIIIRFRIRTKKGVSKNTAHYIYCRLRVNGVQARSDISTGVSCLPSEFDRKAQKIKGHTQHVREQNVKLEKFRNDLDSIYNDLRRLDRPVSAEIVKSIYINKANKLPTTLLALYDLYVKENKEGIVQDSTVGIWKSRKKVIEKYIEKVFKRKDLDLLEITPKWIQNFHKYGIKNLKFSLSYTAYIIQCIKAVLDYAVIEGALLYNPTLSMSFSYSTNQDVKYLLIKEVEKLTSIAHDSELQTTVDLFVLQCFSGMAYNEIKHFDASKHLETDLQGISWIILYRGKTKELCRIPLLHQARNILEKYNYILPKVRNDDMNKRIKIAANNAGLSNAEAITTHVGRKTCGCYLLNAGVRIEVVSKILGHKSVKTTEKFYARILTSSISDDLKKNGLL